MSMLTGGGGTLMMIGLKGKLPKEDIPAMFCLGAWSTAMQLSPEIGRSAAVIIEVILLLLARGILCVLFLYNKKFSGNA